MYSVKILLKPDTTWVSEYRENCLILMCPKDCIVEPNQMFIMDFEAFYDFPEDLLGVPYIPKDLRKEGLKLYHSEKGFRLRGNGRLTVTFINVSDKPISILRDCPICHINLMTIQYYKLMVRHDDSDKGLRSSKIKIELYEKE